MNNFDQSSTGLNISVSAFRDTDLSRFYFEYAFFTIKEGRKDCLVYCEGNFSDFEKEYTFTKKELLAAIVDQHFPAMVEYLWLKDDFKTRMGFTLSKATKQDLVTYTKEVCYYVEDWQAFCEKAGFKANFDIVVSCGYCQGDYREVIVPHKFWDCIGIVKPLDVQSNLCGYIDNLLWDCPVYCQFEVNGIEFNVSSELKDSYDWDKAEALEIAAKLIKDSFTSEEQVIIMNFLASSLKTDLDYL